MCPVQQWGQIQGQLPKKTAEVLLHMLKNAEWPWLDGTIDWSILPYTKSLWVQSPVEARMGGNQSLFLFLSLALSDPSPLLHFPLYNQYTYPQVRIKKKMQKPMLNLRV